MDQFSFAIPNKKLVWLKKKMKQKINILSSPKFQKSYVLIVLSPQTMFVFVMN